MEKKSEAILLDSDMSAKVKAVLEAELTILNNKREVIGAELTILSDKLQIIEGSEMALGRRQEIHDEEKVRLGVERAKLKEDRRALEKSFDTIDTLTRLLAVGGSGDDLACWRVYKDYCNQK